MALRYPEKTKIVILRGKLFELYKYFVIKPQSQKCLKEKCPQDQLEHFYELEESKLPEVYNIQITWGTQTATWKEIFYILLTFPDFIDMNEELKLSKTRPQLYYFQGMICF